MGGPKYTTRPTARKSPVSERVVLKPQPTWPSSLYSTRRRAGTRTRTRWSTTWEAWSIARTLPKPGGGSKGAARGGPSRARVVFLEERVESPQDGRLHPLPLPQAHDHAAEGLVLQGP